MLSDQEFEILKEELYNPNSWHWKIDVKTGWFAHHAEFIETLHINKVLEELKKDESEKGKAQFQDLISSIKILKHIIDKPRDGFPEDKRKNILDAIGKLLLPKEVFISNNSKKASSEIEREKREAILVKFGFPSKEEWQSNPRFDFAGIKREVYINYFIRDNWDMVLEISRYSDSADVHHIFRNEIFQWMPFLIDDEKKFKILNEVLRNVKGEKYFFLSNAYKIFHDSIAKDKNNFYVACNLMKEIISLERSGLRSCEKMNPFSRCNQIILDDIEKVKILVDIAKANTDGFFESIDGIIFLKNFINNDNERLRKTGILLIKLAQKEKPEITRVVFRNLLTYTKIIDLDFDKLKNILNLLFRIVESFKYEFFYIQDFIFETLPFCHEILSKAAVDEETQKLVIKFFKIYHNQPQAKWINNKVLLKYALEIFLNNYENRHLNLLERIRLRNATNFKMEFIKHGFRKAHGVEITDGEIKSMPFSSWLKMLSSEIRKKDLIKAQNCILNSKKKDNFPLDKIYYKQSTSGIRIERMEFDSVKQALIDIINVTATMPTRWESRHDGAKNNLIKLLNDEKKLQDLIYFFQSCINQGAYFKDISNNYKRLQLKTDQFELLNIIENIRKAAQKNKFRSVNNELYDLKVEPLNDILTLLKSQLDESTMKIDNVIIKTQKPHFTDLFDYDTVHCCALYPFHNQKGALGYLEDDHIILLQYITQGKKGPQTIYGIIICILCEDENGKSVLLIDSAEGDENWLKIMKNWQATYQEVIRKLAKDSKANFIMYANNKGGTVPKEFVNYISKSIQPTKLFLKKKNDVPRYIDAFITTETIDERVIPTLHDSGIVDGFLEKVDY